MDFLDTELLGNPLTRWAAAFGTAAAVPFVLLLARSILASRLRRLAGATAAKALDVAAHVSSQTKAWALMAVGIFVGARGWLHLPEAGTTLVVRLTLLALIVQAGIWCTAAVRGVLEYERKQQLEADPGAVATLDLVGYLARLSIWVVVVLLILDNLDFNVTALVAGLGVGGIAVALAAQNILGDLFASLSIVLDKPFGVGDYLALGDEQGTVERVGIKTTRMRSLTGEQLIFSNADLLKSRVRNYGRMQERRSSFTVGVTYETPTAKLAAIPGTIREIVEAQGDVRFLRSHFKTFGDFALLFETVYYVLKPDYELYVDRQQRINLALKERFERDGIEFAYPTQKIYTAEPRAAAPS